VCRLFLANVHFLALASPREESPGPHMGNAQVPRLNLSSAGHYKSDADKGLLAPIASLLEGQYSRQALQVWTFPL